MYNANDIELSMLTQNLVAASIEVSLAISKQKTLRERLGLVEAKRDAQIKECAVNKGGMVTTQEVRHAA